MEPIETYRRLETPCFVLDTAELRRSISGFQEALQSNFQRTIVGYSVKTNSTPYCLRIAHEMGVYAEVVSSDEYELALLCGFRPNRIIYNGPMKSRESFLETIISGGIVNIETKRELVWLKELPLDRIYKVGIRLNVNISRISQEDADCEDDNSRFGFHEETGELATALRIIGELPNVVLSGLHIHRTAHSRSVRFYERLLQFACGIIRKYDLNLDYIDVGGGYYGIFPNKPTYHDYSDAIKQALRSNNCEDLCVIIEPGNALVASSFTFVSQVIDVKDAGHGRWFITTDGSRNDIDPFFRKTAYLDEEIYSSPTVTAETQIISGCTCLEYDRLFTIKNKPLLSVGDYIVYHNVGAYTMCLTPMFIRYVPTIYANDGSAYHLIRERWTAKDFTTKNIING